MNQLIPQAEVAGVILTGGRSTRMGRNKATAALAGMGLWEHVYATLSPIVREVVIAGAISDFAMENVLVLRDDPEGLGPLGGIVTALEKSGYQHHLVVGVDYPLVRPQFLRLLLVRSAGVQAVCGRSAEHLEPLVAYYHSACAPEMRAMIAEGDARTHRIFERVPSYVIADAEYDLADPARWTQFNVNTPEDLAAASALLESSYPQ